MAGMAADSRARQGGGGRSSAWWGSWGRWGMTSDGRPANDQRASDKETNWRMAG
jgi:hypothetical protein